MATAEVTVVPVGREGAGVADLMAEIATHLGSQDRVAFEMGAMGTSLEGEVADILELVGEIQEIPLRHGIPRVYTVLKLDNRSDAPAGLADKVDAVARLLPGGESGLSGGSTRRG